MPRVQRGKGTAISMRWSRRGLFSFGTKREPERTAVPGGHESPSGAFKPQTGLRSKCRVFSAARAQRFRRAGPTRKGLLAPFNPKEDGLHTKKRAASLNAFCVPPFQGPSAAAAAAPRRGAGAPSPSPSVTPCPLFCRCATSSPDRGKSFKGRGKKHSHYALGSLSKEKQEACPPRSWLSLRESWQTRRV